MVILCLELNERNGHIYDERKTKPHTSKFCRRNWFPLLDVQSRSQFAYAAALARETLGCFPQEIEAACSEISLRTSKASLFPGQMIWGESIASAILGVVGGNCFPHTGSAFLRNKRGHPKTGNWLEPHFVNVRWLQGTANLHIVITAKGKNDEYALVKSGTATLM